ncbi:MAG: inositol monophosphatase family protein [Candidatus Krumholzibacteriia bacterium]
MTPRLPETEKLLSTWCREAGEIALGLFRRTGPLRFKHGREAITEADREIERLLSARIRARFPEDGIWGEEYGRSEGRAAAPDRSPSGRVWHLDPIDGTLNFALGLPAFCTSVALMDGAEILTAAIYNPLLDEGFTATAGEGARLNGVRMQVSARAELAEAVVSAQLQKKGRFISNAALLQAVLLGTMKMRRLGTIALEMAYVADARFDALVAGKGEPQPLYDVAAGILLVREAGGRVTDHRGAPYSPGATDLVASNGLVHDELIALIARHDTDA